MDDFVPSDLLKKIFRFWWVILLLMIAGGAAGILISQLQKPIFESQASITTSIDFAYANRLDDDEEDYLIATVGDVIGSSQVFEVVKEQASGLGITLTDQDILNYFTRARQGYRWEVTVRNADPKIAQTLTQLWVEAAGSALDRLRENTLDSVVYHSAEIALQNCFSQIVIVEPVSVSCSIQNLGELRAALAGTSAPVEPAFPDSILLSKISTEISDNAYLPGGPIVYKRNLMALAGCVGGLLIGLGFFIFGKFKTP